MSPLTHGLNYRSACDGTKLQTNRYRKFLAVKFEHLFWFTKYVLKKAQGRLNVLEKSVEQHGETVLTVRGVYPPLDLGATSPLPFPHGKN